MRLSIVASATLSLLLVIAPGVRAQDDPKPAKPDKEKTDDKKKDDKSEKKKGGEKGDEGDDDDDKPKKPEEKLPINPFSKAKKGDWSYCVGKMKIKANFNGQAINQSENVKLTFKVTKVSADEIECTMSEKGGGPMGGKETKATFSLKEPPTFSKYMNGRDDAPQGKEQLEEWKTEDDKKTVGEKEFSCKKVTAKLKDAMGTDAKLTLWVTDETKGWGCVALSLKGTIMGGGTLNMEVELKGYGNGDTADFGKKAEDDKAADEGADDDSGKKKEKGADEGDAPKKDKKKDKKSDDD